MNKKNMNVQELKEAIAQDIETIKTLDVDIMPAREYYELNARLFLSVFFKMYGTILLGYALPCLFYWRELVGSSAQELLKVL